MNVPAVSFAGYLADAEMAAAAAGFSTSLWIPEFGWEAAEEEAAEAPHPPQMLAALQCFLAFFAKPVQRFWVHLAAEMQAGKTGVVTALIRLILSNAMKLGIRPTRIFILTGMNDNAWKKQTRDRLPSGIRHNVHHNGGLTKFAKSIAGLCTGDELRDVLIILDESHLASAVDNRPQKLIYETVARLCPQAKWQENRIRFLTISATDPAKVLVMRGEETAQVVRLQTTEHYQSVESLSAARRIRWLETFKDLHEESGMAELFRCVTEEFGDAPRYHILRARYGKQELLMAKLRTAFPGCPVLKFDSEEKIGGARRGAAAGAEETSSGLSEIEDINELLSEAPEQHTFIVLKNMFYAAKTLQDEFVGVLWDRLSGKDDTNLQSLLGRACGYGKSDRTIVYAARQTVENYLRFWKELCANPRFPPALEGVPASKLVKRMPLLKTRAGGMASSSRHAAPLSAASGGAVGEADGGAAGGGSDEDAPARKKANEDDFEHSYKEHTTLEAAKFKHMRTPKKDEDGFYLTSTSSSPQKQPYAAVITICTGKKTSNLPWGSLAVGESVNRLYVGYKDIAKPDTVVFIVRTLTRLR